MNRRESLKLALMTVLTPVALFRNEDKFERLGEYHHEELRIELRKYPHAVFTTGMEAIELLKPIPVHIYLVGRPGQGMEEVPVVFTKELENIPARNAEGLYGIYHKARFIPNSCV